MSQGRQWRFRQQKRILGRPRTQRRGRQAATACLRPVIYLQLTCADFAWMAHRAMANAVTKDYRDTSFSGGTQLFAALNACRSLPSAPSAFGISALLLLSVFWLVVRLVTGTCKNWRLSDFDLTMLARKSSLPVSGSAFFHGSPAVVEGRTHSGLRARSSVATVCSLPPDYANKLQGYKVLVAGATGKTGR